MKTIVGFMMLGFTLIANAQGDTKSVENSQVKSLPEVALKRRLLLSVMETACSIQQNQGEQRIKAIDECKIVSLAHSSGCLEHEVCEPVDTQIKQYIQSVKDTPSTASQ